MQEIGVDEVACLVDFGIPQETVLENLPALLELKERIQNSVAVVSERQIEIRQNGESVAALIQQHNVTHFQCTPSMARMLISDTETRESLGKIRHWLIGGEPLTPDLWGDLQTVASGRVINMYGPTETTIWSTTQEMRTTDRNVLIGKPITNTQVYVLDQHRRLLPFGAVGELFIGGHGVVRGYLDRDELTQSKFISSPFEIGERLYRTGDLVRWHQGGDLEYVGRTDSQLKLRGHRIELGEIESQIVLHDAVKQAVVEPSESSSGTKRLVAYVVLQEGRGLELQELREFLASFLPEFMLPAQLVKLKRLPLTPNKKVDRNKLRSWHEKTESSNDPNRDAPRTPEEQRLAEIFAVVLGVNEIGRFDNFLDLGGDSLAAVDVFTRIQRAFDVDLPLFEFFDSPTISGIAAKLADKATVSATTEPSPDELERLIEQTMQP